MAVDRNIDFQALAQAIKTNGDFRIAPQTEIRMGQVIGYDPNYNSTTQSHGWPYVSITLYGDKNPMHRIRFSEWYIPNLGDVVWVALSGPDAWVMGALAGADKQTIGQLRSPVAVLKSLHSTDTTTISAANGTKSIPACSITAPYLPNRIYRVEASVTFTVTNAAALSDTGLTAALANAPTASGMNVTATTGFVSVADPSVSVLVGTGVPDQGGTGRTTTLTHAPVSGTTIYAGVNTHQEIQTLTIQADLVAGDYSLQNVTGYLSLLQALLQNACDTGGNVYVSGYGLPGATQIIGMNWGSSTTVAGSTGVIAAGSDTSHVNLTGWSPSTTGYFAYTNYAVGTTATNQNLQVIYISGGANNASSPFTTSATQGAVSYDNSKLTKTNPTISKPNINVTPNSFTKSNYSKVSVGVLAPNPNGSPTYQEITTLDVTGATNGQQFTLTGTQTFWEIPNHPLTPKTWNGGNGPTFDWQLAMIAEEVGASSFQITGVSQQMFVYDCGVAS